MLRAKDRLEEAEFFFEKLEKTEGKGREFRYYLSACVSASRSITLVLQKDLRSKHGPQFDDWWDEKKDTVPAYPISFEVIRRLRNALQKQGNIVSSIFKLKGEDKVLKDAEVQFDLDTETLSVIYVVPRDKVPTIIRREGESDTGFESRLVTEAVRQTVPAMMDDLRDHKDLELQGYRLSEDSPPLPFDSIVSGFSTYLSAIRTIIEEAEHEFLHTGT